MARSRNGAFELLALELASGSTVRDASAKVGVSESAAYRKWRDDPAFRSKVDHLRAVLLAQASGVLVAAMTQAATTLRSLLDAESEMVQLGAAKAILELGMKIREAVEIEQRLIALEARAAACKKKTP